MSFALKWTRVLLSGHRLDFRFFESQVYFFAHLPLLFFCLLARSGFLLYQLATAINSGNYPGLELEVEQEQEQELIVEQQVDASWLNAMANEFQV